MRFTILITENALQFALYEGGTLISKKRQTRSRAMKLI
jgi:hypothetical protein